MTKDEAEDHVMNRDLNNMKRYKDLYDIDITNLGNFDLCLSSKTYKPEQMVEIVKKALELR